MRQLGLAVAATLFAVAAHAQGTPPAAAPGLVPAPGNANLSVASVRMADGVRASKIIGAGVYGDDHNTQLGTVDDLMLAPDHRVVYAIVSVGGVLGMGGKLVAIPVAQLATAADGKFAVAGATKDSLGAMPSFVYGN